MSIVGLTIDYGPFGFMDYYDPDFICNGSGMPLLSLLSLSFSPPILSSHSPLFLPSFSPLLTQTSSDHEGRYSFKNQPSVCKWNCQKLAEAIAPLLPLKTSMKILEDQFDSTFDHRYHEKMRRKVPIGVRE